MSRNGVIRSAVPEGSLSKPDADCGYQCSRSGEASLENSLAVAVGRDKERDRHACERQAGSPRGPETPAIHFTVLTVPTSSGYCPSNGGLPNAASPKAGRAPFAAAETALVEGRRCSLPPPTVGRARRTRARTAAHHSRWSSHSCGDADLASDLHAYTGTGTARRGTDADRGSGRYCGLVENSVGHPEEPEPAFEFLQQFWGQGFATEASRVIVGRAKAIGYGHLASTVGEWNTASLNLLNKLEFVSTGQRERDVVHGDLLKLRLPLR